MKSKGLIASLWRSSLRWRYWLLWKRRHNRLVLEHVGTRPFLILPEVFNPTLFWTSEVLVGTFNDRLIRPGSQVLDLGTGSGVGAVFAAQWASRVVAVDINSAAVRCARINALLNQVESKVEIRLGDLFAPVPSERFDVVLFNPPFLPGEPVSMMDQAFYSTGLSERFAGQLCSYLKPHGYALVVLSSFGSGQAFLDDLRDNGFTSQPIHTRTLPGERITVYLVAPSPETVPGRSHPVAPREVVPGNPEHDHTL